MIAERGLLFSLIESLIIHAKATNSSPKLLVASFSLKIVRIG